MQTENQHQMIIVKTYSTGAQEWYCHSCGRHIILQWPPNYKRIILDEGDAQVVHAGGMCEPITGAESIQPAKPEGEPTEQHSNTIHLDDPYLLPWLRWIGDRDF